MNNKDKKIQGDCIKVLYETGYIKPELIANYHKEFIDLLDSKNNKMVWSGMIAITTITDLFHKQIFDNLSKIMTAVDKGSVITIDCGVIILAKLTKHKEYFDTTNPLFMEQLRKCPIKQLPMYSENSLICITARNKPEFLSIIETRIIECEKESQKTRLMKVLKKKT